MPNEKLGHVYWKTHAQRQKLPARILISQISQNVNKKIVFCENATHANIAKEKN